MQDKPVKSLENILNTQIFPVIVENSLDAIALAKSSTLIYGNKALLPLFGYENQAELLGRDFSVLIAGREQEKVFEYVRRAAAESEACPPSAPCESRGRRKDGSEFDLEMRVLPCRKEGEFYSVFTLQDISARKESEIALRESNERWRLLLQNAPDYIVTLDLEGRFLFSNRFAPGYTPEMVIGKTIYSMTSPEFHELARNTFDHVARTGESASFEVSGIGPYDTKSWYANRVGPVWRAGKVTGFMIIATEITARKSAEEALRIEKDFREILVEASPTFFVAIRPDGRVMLMNISMLKSLGYELDEVVGKDYLSNFVPPEDRAVLGAVFERILTRNEVTINENQILTRDGRKLLVEWHGNPVFKSNQLEFFFGVGVDITERRRAEQERNALERALLEAQNLERLGVMAAGIAHDFNNLLAVISGNAGIVQGQLPVNSTLSENMKNIQAAAQSAASICRKMLAYAGGGIVSEPLDFNSMVMEMALLLKSNMPGNIEFGFDLSRKVPLMRLEATQVRQVVMNLILNASEAIGNSRGRISIATGVLNPDEVNSPNSNYVGAPSQYVFLDIRDTGCGMDAATKARIFEPYFSTKFFGRGLGLAAVHGIVRSHKGAITVESVPKAGSRFRVILPVDGGPTPN